MWAPASNEKALYLAGSKHQSAEVDIPTCNR
jgi:hypothetical protein